MSKVLSVLFCAAIVSSAYASKLTDLLQDQIGTKMVVIDEQVLSQDSNLKIVTLKDEESGYKALVLTNKGESIIVPIMGRVFTANDKDRDTIINTSTSVASYNDTFKTQAAVKAVIDKLPQDYIITIKGTGKKVFYIISDPQCPHCQLELDNIDKRLEQGDVKMIPIGMMGDVSAKKAAEIHEMMKSAKSNSDKIAILKKVYSRTYEPSKSIDTKQVQEITRSLLGEDKVSGTPYIIEEEK